MLELPAQRHARPIPKNQIVCALGCQIDPNLRDDRKMARDLDRSIDSEAQRRLVRRIALLEQMLGDRGSPGPGLGQETETRERFELHPAERPKMSADQERIRDRPKGHLLLELTTR